MRPRISKPAPFQRDGIKTENHGKAWQTIYATYLSEGDIVPDHGMIEFVAIEDDNIYVKFVSGESAAFFDSDEVYAFTEKHG